MLKRCSTCWTKCVRRRIRKICAALNGFTCGESATAKKFMLNEKGIDDGPAILSPDGKLLATARGAAVCLWQRGADLATWTPRQPLIGNEGAVRCLAFSPDSQSLVTGGSGANHPGAARVWNLGTGTCKAIGVI